MPDTPTQPEKNACGRPTKLTAEFIAAAHEVVEQGDNALIFTDAELLFQINEKLSHEARIDRRTFERWKAGEVKDDIEGQELCRLIEKSLHKQKTALSTSLKTGTNQWQRWAWIIERKFDEWNLKKKLGITKLPEDGAASLATALLGADDVVDDGENAEPAAAAGDAPANG